MSDTREIYVRLLGERVDVWRPVQAEHLHDNVQKITNQPYDPENEAWQFEPGDIVCCELTKLSNGLVRAPIRLQE